MRLVRELILERLVKGVCFVMGTSHPLNADRGCFSSAATRKGVGC